MVPALFDEDIPRQVAEALHAFGCQASHVLLVPELASGATDHEIIRWCSDKGAELVTADYKMKTTQRYAGLLRRNRVSAAFFRPPSKQGWTAKDWLRQVVNRMDDMQREFSERSPVYRAYRSRGAPEDLRL
jgi:hypothetical protein